MKNRILYTLKNYYERYDSLDVISSFGAMNLEFDNQNKNLLTSYATIVGLFNIKPDLAFDKCVKSINNKSIRNEACETLGDIDILAIDKAKKRIYLIETKRFYYSRNPSELDDEIKDMFVGTKKRKPFLTKELLRKEWIEKHITDVVEHYGLNGNGWNVRYTFLTYKPLISTEFVSYSINHIDLKNITLSYLRKLKQ